MLEDVDVKNPIVFSKDGENFFIAEVNNVEFCFRQKELENILTAMGSLDFDSGIDL
jgi:hypothetical protein